MNKDLEKAIEILEEEFRFDDDKVLYSLISDGWSYDDLVQFYSTSSIERMSGAVMRNEEV
jgi:hypothetical protein